MQERMNMRAWSWDDVRLFLAAARAGSLTGAGRALGVNQSTASRRLAALEAALGARLFDRHRDGLVPTPLTVDLLPLAERAEAAMFGFLEVVAGQDEGVVGTVRLAVPDGMDSLLVVPELPVFYQRHPGVALEVVGSASLANLARREADLALRFVRPAAGDYVVRRLASVSVGVWARPGAPARWILADEASPEDAAWAERHVPAEAVRLRVNRTEARVAAVQAGLGCALLPDAAARMLGGLERRAQGAPLPACDLWMVAHRPLYRVPRVRAVWDFLAEVVADRLEGGGGG